jgi:hypothetical protein
MPRSPIPRISSKKTFMSFFTTKERLRPEALEQELILFSNVQRLNLMMESCYNRCIAKSTIHDELDKGRTTFKENKCTDDCVLKYFRVAEIVETLSKERMEKEQQMQKQLEEAQSS